MKLVCRTGVEGTQLVACLLGSGHALEQRLDSYIFFAPEVIGNYKRASGS